uniref:NADH-ubiquinone oxidoreductase chain 2 n=1 Tax=Aposthonia japonica TaxID=911381 RepID=H7CD23_9NEOP|nr:NADH dehydrogenase subunit 2 [Aposthonia japonica]
MFNPNYIMFSTILIISTISVTAANSWFNIWMMLEINLMSFIPMISKKSSYNSTETSIKYFLIQALSSSIMLFLIMNFQMLQTFTYIILIPIMMKLGSPPFHFWFTNVMEGLSWTNCFILMTWQKMAPISITTFYNNKLLVIMISISAIMVGSMGGLNQTSIRKLLTFSSINHLGWMMTINIFNEQVWMKYFIIYMIMNMSLIMILNKYIYNMKQIFLKLNPTLSMTFTLNLLSLSGLPPLLGFLPKWISMQLLTYMNLLPLSTTMIMFSLPMLFYYFYLMYNNLSIFFLSNSWKSSQSSLNISMIISLTIILMLPMLTPLWI